MGKTGKDDSPVGQKEPFESIFLDLAQSIFSFAAAKYCWICKAISRFWWGITLGVVLFVQY